MRQTGLWTGLAGALLLSLAGTAAAECAVQSGTQRIALLELYTSEGCSSCPPADRWLAELGPKGLAPARVVPLALHVDYWNYLGWTDPFSQPRYTERQQAHRARGGARTVYTPQFILNGREYRGWFRGDDFARRLENTDAAAVIALRLARANEATLEATGEISVAETAKRQRAEVYLALYENNLANDVRAGENRGERLRHDYVVRRLEGPFSLQDDGRLALRQRFRLSPDWKRTDLGVAVFVQDRESGEVLQAAMLPPCLK
jgi:hypothetical protein